MVPASLVGNWKSEFERFSPSLRVFYAHRSECDAAILKSIADAPEKSLANFDVVVTTYGLARRLKWFSKLNWRLIVLDEAQAIKNASSAQARAIRKLKSSGRIALSGTPIENHLGELWSLFDFCCPGLLGNASQFKTFVKGLKKTGHNSLRSPAAVGAALHSATDENRPEHRTGPAGQDRNANPLWPFEKTGHAVSESVEGTD